MNRIGKPRSSTTLRVKSRSAFSLRSRNGSKAMVAFSVSPSTVGNFCWTREYLRPVFPLTLSHAPVENRAQGNVMKTYTGNCHCGKVRFQMETDLSKVTLCNCSICTKKGAVHHRIPAHQFKLLAGEESLSLYQFGTKTARHHFCKCCGIHPFSNPRSAPEMVSINVRCLGDFDLDLSALAVTKFDGRNWE